MTIKKIMNSLVLLLLAGMISIANASDVKTEDSALSSQEEGASARSIIAIKVKQRDIIKSERMPAANAYTPVLKYLNPDEETDEEKISPNDALNQYPHVQLFSTTPKTLTEGHKKLDELYTQFGEILKCHAAIVFTERGSKWIRGTLVFFNMAEAIRFRNENTATIPGGIFPINAGDTSQANKKINEWIEQIEYHAWPALNPSVSIKIEPSHIKAEKTTTSSFAFIKKEAPETPKTEEEETKLVKKEEPKLLSSDQKRNLTWGTVVAIEQIDDRTLSRGYRPVFRLISPEDFISPLDAVNQYYRVQLFTAASGKNLEVAHDELERFAGIDPTIKKLNALVFNEKEGDTVINLFVGQLVFNCYATACKFMSKHHSNFSTGIFMLNPGDTTRAGRKADKWINEIEFHRWR